MPSIHGKHGQGKGWYGLRLSIVISSNGWDMFAIVLQCPICNKSITDFTEKLEVQEKVPVIHGGTRKYNNLQLVHRYCNKQYYKIFPLEGELPTKQQKQKGYKIIRQLRLAEIL